MVETFDPSAQKTFIHKTSPVLPENLQQFPRQYQENEDAGMKNLIMQEK